MSAIDDVIAERAKQVAKWCVERDDEYRKGELACAGAYLASPAWLGVDSDLIPSWALHLGWDYEGNRRQELVIAAALIVAEIERLDRAATRSE